MDGRGIIFSGGYVLNFRGVDVDFLSSACLEFLSSVASKPNGHSKEMLIRSYTSYDM